VPHIDNLDWLKTFVAVADHGTFSGAARAVHRSQSRVSAHIAGLEGALGAALFDRRHRPVELTDAGIAFLPHARVVLAQLAEGSEAVNARLGVLRGRVVLGAHPSVSATFLPPVLRDFAHHHPEVQVELTEDTSIGLSDSLVSGALHLALRSTTAGPAPEGLAVRELWAEPYVAVVPEGHPLTQRGQPLTPTELAGARFVGIARPGWDVDPDTRTVLDRWDIDHRVAWRTEQPQTLANLVKAGLGVGIINGLAMESCETTGLVVLQVGPVAGGRVVGAWWDPARHMSAATRALLAAVLAAPLPRGTFTAPS
jgi:DNA-binding transcriptional LysR family regulator